MKKYSKFLAVLLAVAMVLPGMAGVVEAATDLTAGDTLYTVIDLNLRSKENDRSAPVVYTPRGVEVKFVEEADNDYFKVEYNGEEGYVDRADVTSFYKGGKVDESIALKDGPNNKTYKVVKNDVLRSKDLRNALPTKVVQRGEEVKHLGTTNNDYFLVESDGVKGYI